MEAIKIVIVDNNPFFSEDLKLILECEFSAQVIAVIDNDEDLFDLTNLKVDIIFINLTVARRNRFQTIKRFLWEYPQMKVIGINTFFSEPTYLLQLIEVGIKGCVDGNNIYNEISEAVNNVMHGRLFFTQNVKNNLCPNKDELFFYN